MLLIFFHILFTVSKYCVKTIAALGKNLWSKSITAIILHWLYLHMIVLFSKQRLQEGKNPF